MGKKSRAKKAVASVEARPTTNSGLGEVIRELIANRQYEEAFRAASVLVEQDPLDANAHAIMALLMSRMNRFMEALRHYELAIRLGRTNDATLYAGVAVSALSGQLLFHAVSAARQGTLLAPSPEDQQLFKAVADAGRQQVQQLTGTRNLPVDTVEQAMLLVERSARARQEADYDHAHRLAVEATELAAGLPATWYNLALLNWTLETVPAAIATCDQGMDALQEQDAELLAAAVRMQEFTGEHEAARSTLERLAVAPAPGTAEKTEVARGYAAFDDDQSVYDLLSGVAADQELPTQKFLLGVAAANLGKRDEARAAWRSLVRDQNPHARAYSEIMARNEKPPTPGGRYPYFQLIELVPGAAIDRLVGSAREQVDPPDVADVAARYPKLIAGLCEAFVVPIVDPRFVVQILLQVPDTATIGALRTYAESRLPTDYDRLFAHIVLRGAGLVDDTEPASVWLAGRHLSITTPALCIETPKVHTHPSDVEAILHDASAAQRENALGKAIDLYRRALTINPDVAEAEHNLGTALLLSGRIDEGETHIRRSLEIDDSYAIARCNLASIELSRGRATEAAEQIAPLDARRRMSVEEIVAYLRTKAEIARAQGDSHRSEELLHCLLAFDHSNTLAHDLLARHGATARQSA